MLVSEAITLLQSSEVKMLSVGEDETALLGFINLGILELYKEFSLRKDEADIVIGAGPKRLYALDGTDIDVTIDLTDHELIVIEDIYDTYGRTLALNDTSERKCGATIPTFNTIDFKIEELEEGDEFKVAYRSTPEFLTATTDTVPLQSPFLEALFSFVGYKAHKSQTGEQAGEHRIHMRNYKDALAVLKSTGTYTEDSMECNKFYSRGFV